MAKKKNAAKIQELDGVVNELEAFYREDFEEFYDSDAKNVTEYTNTLFQEVIADQLQQGENDPIYTATRQAIDLLKEYRGLLNGK